MVHLKAPIPPICGAPGFSLSSRCAGEDVNLVIYDGQLTSWPGHRVSSQSQQNLHGSVKVVEGNRSVPRFCFQYSSDWLISASVGTSMLLFPTLCARLWVPWLVCGPARSAELLADLFQKRWMRTAGKKQ